MEISNMNNYTNFLNVCIAIYNKGKDLSHALPVIINKYLDTSDTESLKSDLRNFYAENIKDFHRLNLSLTQLNSSFILCGYVINFVYGYSNCFPFVFTFRIFSIFSDATLHPNINMIQKSQLCTQRSLISSLSNSVSTYFL